MRMSGFFRDVYRVVACIPEGKVATYGQIAALLGYPRRARIVGWAMANVPSHMNLPCHRVVSKKGILAPHYVFGGREVQRALLEKEGITFLKDGSINMKEHGWQPD